MYPNPNLSAARSRAQTRSGRDLPRTGNPAFQDHVDDNPMQAQTPPPPQGDGALGAAILNDPKSAQPPASRPQIAAQPTEQPQGPQGPLSQLAPTAKPTTYATKLMEGDAGKLANVNHAKKSPKYDFLQLAQQNKFNYDQLPQMLAELQKGPNAHHWQGWTADRDKFKFTGDPGQLGEAWKGVTVVDAVGGFNSGNPQGWRWGADDGGQMAAQANPNTLAMTQALGGAIMPNVTGANGGGFDPNTDYSKMTLQQILAALGGQQ